MKLYLLFLISCTCMNSVCSQNLLLADGNNLREKKCTPAAKTEKNSDYRWEFFSALPDSFDESILQNVEENGWDQKVACLKILVDRYYIRKEEMVPGDPTMRTVIRKPEIYNTARKIEKYLKKEVKKGNLTMQQAGNELAYVLEVAIAAIDEIDTHDFESSLNKSDSAYEQINVFKQVKLNYLY